MSNFFVYRNCFTGNVAGGDMHTGGVADWIHRNHPEHDLYLVHAAGDGQDKAYRETNGLAQITYPDTSLRHPALMFLARAHKAIKIGLSWSPDGNIFIAGSHFIPDVWPVLGQGQKAPGTTRVVYIHHIVQEMPRPKNLQTLFANLQEKFCFSLIRYHFDKIITVNQEVVDSLRARGFEQPILVSSNFVNVHDTKPVPYAKKDIDILFCGRLVNQKGLDDFLYICEQLQPQIPDFSAVMIGEGPEADRLKKEIRERKLNIKLTGFLEEKQKFDLLARSKLFVFPSVEEGWGIVIAESMSVGTPVLAYDLAVYEDPFGAFLETVPLRLRDRMAERAGQLLKDYRAHPADYGELQQLLMRHAEAFTVDNVAAKEYEFIMEDTNA